MLLCSTLIFNGLIFIIGFRSFAIAFGIFSKCDSKNTLDKYCHNRVKRDGKLKYKAVCGELDKTEDSPFIAMVVTRNPGRLLCMGSIIDEYHVLTAKRCFEKNDASAIMIIAGYQSPYYGKNSQVKFVEKVIKNNKELAILLLKKPFHFSETVKAIRLIGPDKIREKFKPAYETPFKTFGIAGITIPKYLQQGDYLPKTSAYYMDTELPVDQGKCTEHYKGDDPIEVDEKFMFCTNGKTEFCWSGIGSPTVVMMDKNYVQIGVLVMGMCTTSTPEKKRAESRNGGNPPGPNPPGPNPAAEESDKYIPNVHIRIDKFHKWIKANSYIDLK